MKEDVQARWTEDLETTDAAQGKGFLRAWNDELKRWEYCCLGRLCELSGLAEWVETQERDPDDGNQTITVSSYLGQTKYLPDEVATWAGLVTYTLATGNETAQGHFAELNDDGNAFPDIAAQIPDVLEAYNEDE
jgi:hypothetical protein